MSKSKSKKGKEEKKKKKKSASRTQERGQQTACEVIAHTSGLQGAREGCSADRIKESAIKESREAKRKAKTSIQEANGKRQDERTKQTKKEQGRGTRRTTKDRGKTYTAVVPFSHCKYNLYAVLGHIIDFTSTASLERYLDDKRERKNAHSSSSTVFTL